MISFIQTRDGLSCSWKKDNAFEDVWKGLGVKKEEGVTERCESSLLWYSSDSESSIYNLYAPLCNLVSHAG